MYGRRATEHRQKRTRPWIRVHLCFLLAVLGSLGCKSSKDSSPQPKIQAASPDPGWTPKSITEDNLKRRKGDRCQPFSMENKCSPGDRSPRCEWVHWVIDGQGPNDRLPSERVAFEGWLSKLMGKQVRSLKGPPPLPFKSITFKDGVHKGYKLKPPIDWKADPFKERNWRRQLQDLSLVGKLGRSKKREQLDQAAYLLMDWGTRAMPDQRPADYTWGDHAMSTRATSVGGFLRHYLEYHPEPNLEVARMAARILVSHVFALASSVCYSPGHNHGLFQDQALVTLAQDYVLPSEAALLSLAETRVEKLQVNQSLTPEGIHVENSTSYALGYSTWVSKFVREFWLKRSLPIPPAVKQRLRKLNDNLPYFVQPGLKGPAFGDTRSERTRSKVNKILKSVPNELLSAQSQAAFKYLARGGPPPKLAVDFVEKKSGYATLRSDWPEHPEDATVVHLKASRLSRIHAHEDPTSFTLYSHGTRWIVDAGRYGAGSEKPFGRYQYGTDSHNLLIIDGKQMSPHKAPQIIASSLRPEQSWVQARHFDYRDLGKHGVTRTIALTRPSALAVVDRVEMGGEHELTQHFHLGPGLPEPKQVGPKTWVVRQKDGSALWILSGDPDVKLTTLTGSMKPVQGWYFPNLGKKEKTTDVMITRRTSKDQKGVVFMHTLLVVTPPGKASAPLLVQTANDSEALSWILAGKKYSLAPISNQ